MKRVKAAVALSVSVLLFSGCALNIDQAATFEISGVPPSMTTYDGIPLQDGQIVVAGKGSASALLVTLFAAQYSAFGHSGIVTVEGDKAYVYEALVSLRPYLRGPPTHAMSGKIHKTPLRRFLARHGIVAIYDPPPEANHRLLASFAQAQFQRKKAFDPYFDSADDGRFYCNEFVARALEFAGGSPVTPTPATGNASIQRLLSWLEIDTNGFILVKDVLANARRTVLLSEELSVSQIAAYFSLRRELHRRYTLDQKPGNLFRWSLTGLHFRPGVLRFLREGIESAIEAPDANIEKLVFDLANRHLGPFLVMESLVAADGSSE